MPIGMQLRQFAAAKQSRLTGEWSPVASDINTLIRTSQPIVRNRTRQLVRDFAYFARAVNVLVDHTVGHGITLQSRVTRGKAATGKSKLHTSAIRQIEDAWSRWCDECDASGKLHYHEMERLWKRQDVESGESLAVLAWSPRPGAFLPLTIQMYEPEWLTSNFATASGDNLLDQGVEFDRRTGRVAAYHFAVPDGMLNLTGKTTTQRVPSQDVLHGFEMRSAGQLRGITELAPAILVADDLGDFIVATMDRAKMAAKWLGFVNTLDAKAWQQGRAGTDDLGRTISVMENAIIEFLKPGETVTVNTADVPGDSFTPFTRFILQMLAAATGIPYNMLSCDPSGLNYNMARSERNDFIKANRPRIRRHIRQWSQPVFKAFLDACHLTGRLNLPGYAANPYQWLQCNWQPPGIEPIDMLRDSRAWVELVDNLMVSPQEFMSSMGRDYEQVLNELAEFQEATESRGLAKKTTSKALQTNPAAVAKQGGKQVPQIMEDLQ